MYFFSEIDPNYRIKGSRDPLGFQTLWSAAGRKAVAHLSTVSINLRDFMILSYAMYFYSDKKESGFLNFFLKFEQLCAYARRIYNNETSFNGIDFVSKKKDDQIFSISLNSSDTLLSNQRNYGIYGKYIRPFRDTGIIEDPDFKNILEQSLSKTNVSQVSRLISKLYAPEKLLVSKEDLECIALLLQTITEPERELYRKYILKVQSENHPQNNLYELVSNNNSILEAEFNLHSIVQVLRNSEGISTGLDYALENISNTDRVLFPLNRCFTHLLGISSWTERQINEDPFFHQLPVSVDCDFQDETMRKLNQILGQEKPELIEEIVERNGIVSKQRGSNSWIIKEKGDYKIIYGENGQKQHEIDFSNAFEFTYFLNTYLSLYKQIEISA